MTQSSPALWTQSPTPLAMTWGKRSWRTMSESDAVSVSIGLGQICSVRNPCEQQNTEFPNPHRFDSKVPGTIHRIQMTPHDLAIDGTFTFRFSDIVDVQGED